MGKYETLVEELGGRYIYEGAEEREAISEREITQIESELGFLLPAEYTRFLIDFGGYSFNSVSFPIAGVDELPDACVFYGYKLGAYDLVGRYISDRDNHVIPPNLFPIAADSGENQIYIGITGPELGQIFYWAFYEMNTEDFSTVHFVANSFDEFIRSFHRIEDF